MTADGAAPHVDVAMYVLGKLEPDEAAAFQAHLAACAACRQDLADLEGLPTLLDQAVPTLPDPPEQLRDRTLSAVRQAAATQGIAPRPLQLQPAEQAPSTGVVPTAPQPGAGAATGTVTPLRRRARRQWVALGAVAAAVLALAVLVPTTFLARQPGPTTVALAAPANGQARGQIRVVPVEGGRVLNVTIDRLPPPPDGSLYSLWAVAEDDTPQAPNRVPLQTFATDAAGTVRFQIFTAVPADPFSRFDITLEPQNGDPARDGPEVLVGRSA
jgi:anti-sigma factor RsiW